MANTETHLDLKIFVNKEKNMFLFAEGDGDFVDVLYSFLTLPLGTIARLFEKTQSDPTTIRRFTMLYRSVQKLENDYFSTGDFKAMLLNPRSSTENVCRRLKVNVDDTEAKYFLCPNCTMHMSIYKNTMCSICGTICSVVKQFDPSDYSSKENVFVTNSLKYIITDDLQVTPVFPGTVLGLLNKFGINDISVIEERTEKLGLDEILELLKCTMFSASPLTDLFVSEKKASSLKKQYLQKRGCVDHHRGKDGKINVKAVISKSNKILLFMEVCQDFIDFLFSLLIIPLGEMLHMMDGQSCAGSLDGLYKSIQSLDSKHFVSEDIKNLLLRPKVAPHFNRENNLFHLKSTPITCFINGHNRIMPVSSSLDGARGSRGFLREESVFFVFNNLSVMPHSASTAILLYKVFNLQASDLEERTLSIGMDEGISIIRAALNSSSNAISDGLLVFKESKQEKAII